MSEAGEGWSDNRIIKALETSASMVYRVRKQLVEEGFEAVLSRKQRATPAVARIFDGEKEAKLIALACSKPPKGRARWTLRLLEKKVVELQIVDRASDSTIGRALKKHSPAPSPAVLGHPAEGQWRVRSRHGRCAGGLHAATRSRLPAGVPGRDLQAVPCRDAPADPNEAGTPARCDYEYERNGTANIFMMFAPLEGWRHVKVTDRHTAVDYAHVLKELADRYFANAKTVVLVQDNLNIHGKGSLYEAFPAAEARRLVERFEWHYTPKHGSWLDLAESELGVLTSQCLDRRIADKQTLIEEIAAWEHDRNANHAKANWQFSTPNARIKLKHLYPAI